MKTWQIILFIFLILILICYSTNIEGMINPKDIKKSIKKIKTKGKSKLRNIKRKTDGFRNFFNI